MSKFRLVVLAAIFIFGACAMPETRIYTIHVPSEGRSVQLRSGASIVININSEDYLTQPYIAYRESPYQLSISRYSKWVTSPSRIVSSEFKKALFGSEIFEDVRTANIPLTDYYVLTINLKKFERRDSGDRSAGMLEFDISFRAPDGQELYKGVIAGEEEIETKDFAGLAGSMSILLTKGIEESTTQIYKAVGTRVNALKEQKPD